MSTSRESRYSDHLGITITISIMMIITLAISLLCGMTVPLDSCTHDIGILLAVYYFITELSILAMLLAYILPLTYDEHNFIGFTGMFICFTPSITSICNLILMLDVHAKCRNQLAIHIIILYWIAVLSSLCMLVVVMVYGLILICSRNSVIYWMIDKKWRNDKHKAIIRSMSGDIMVSQRLSISTLSQYINLTREDDIMPHELASHATVIYALLTDISHISATYTCSICNHDIIGGHRVSGDLQGDACHTSCLMAMLIGMYHDSDNDELSSFLKTLIDTIQEYSQDVDVNAIET